MTKATAWQSVALLALSLPLLLAPSNVRAGTFPYWGLSFGTPERAAAHLGFSFGDAIPSDGSEGLAMGTGPVVEVAVGLGAGKIGFGKSILILTEEKSLRVHGDLKAVATRTWDEPRRASAHATYLGVEGGLSVAFVRFTMGVSKRLEEKSQGADWLFNWGAGTQVRIGKAKKQP